MSDIVILQLAAIAIALIGVVSIAVQGLIAIRLKRLDVNHEQAAAKVDLVRRTLEDSNLSSSEKLDGLANVARDTHTLVNSNMQVQLQLHATTARRLAEISGSAEDIAAAELAEQLLKSHEAKQRVVDAEERGSKS